MNMMPLVIKKRFFLKYEIWKGIKFQFFWMGGFCLLMELQRSRVCNQQGYPVKKKILQYIAARTWSSLLHSCIVSIIFVHYLVKWCKHCRTYLCVDCGALKKTALQNFQIIRTWKSSLKLSEKMKWYFLIKKNLISEQNTNRSVKYAKIW